MPMTLPSRKTAPEVTRLSSFRNLYTRVLFDLQDRPCPGLGVTSAIAGEGKTTIASGLASALAQDDALRGFGREPGTILLVECNVGSRPEEPSLALRTGPGLIQVLRGESTLEAAIQQVGVQGLSILPVGEPVHNFPLAIRTAAVTDVISELRAQFGLIIFDMPPVLNSTDTQVLARLADQLILVVRAEVTPAKLVRQALDELGEETVLGVVLNESRSSLPSWLEQRL